MTPLLVAGLVLLALLALGLLRLGVFLEQDNAKLHVKIKVGPVRITILPKKPGKKKKKDKRKPEEKQPAAQRLSLAQLKRFVPLVCRAAGQLRRKVRLDVFYLDFTAAAADPAAAALVFGGANAAIGMIWPLVEQNFNVKDRQIRTRVEFEGIHPELALRLEATLTVAQALSLALRLLPDLVQALRTEETTPNDQKEAV